MSIPLIYRDDVAETFIVKRTQRIYRKYDEDISYFCHLSKNLWNQAHRLVYGYYKKYGRVPSHEEIDAILNKQSYYKKNGKIYPEYDNYHKLGGATAQQILIVYHESWMSYLKEIADYWKNKNNKYYTGIPREPKYKKKDGEFLLIFTNQQIKFRESQKDGSVWATFPKKIENKPSKLKDLKILLGNTNELDPYLLKRIMNGKFDIVRIVPKGTGYWIEIVYDKEVLKDNIYELDKDIIIAIDLGVENLGAITDNIGSRPIIVKCPEIKCVNQWYNKRSSELRSIYDRNIIGKACLVKIDKKEKKVKKVLDKNGNIKFDRIKYLKISSGSKLDIITDNRNKKVMNILHKFSRGIVNHALSIKAGIISIGKNPGWKIKVKMGKRNNQNFVNIPFAKLIDMVRYKAEEYGITVLSPTEEYTSKCSFLDSQSIEYHDTYMGERIKRGLFKASKGTDINSDVQGSYNILVKTPIESKTKFDNVYPKFNVLDIMEGVVVHGLVPKRLSVSDLLKSQVRVNCQMISFK